MKYEWKFPLQGNEDNVLWDLWITPFRNAKKILKVIIKFRFKGARGGGMVKAQKFPLILYVFYFDVFPVCERLEVGPDTGPHHRVHPHCGLVQDENLGTVEQS